MPTSREESIQTNVDELLEKIIAARLQGDPSLEDDAERDYRCPSAPSTQLAHQACCIR